MNNLQIKNSIYFSGRASAVPKKPISQLKKSRQQLCATLKLGAINSDTYTPQSTELLNEAFKKLGIKIRKTTKSDIKTKSMVEILEGLLISKNAGLKLPKVLEIQQSGYSNFDPLHPRTISINPIFKDLADATIHEITHLNDLFGPLLYLIPTIKKRNANLLKENMGIIVKELGESAAEDREEFVAWTAATLLSKGKSWQDLDPKIKEIYDLFKGPKIKLN